MVIIAVSGFALEWIEMENTHDKKLEDMSPASRWSGLKLLITSVLMLCLIKSPASRWSELKYATSASTLGQLRLRLRAEADRNACRNTTTVLGIVFSFTPKTVTIVLTLNTPDKIRTLKLTST